MPIAALALTLAAAAVHATWNLLLSGHPDVRSATRSEAASTSASGAWSELSRWWQGSR